MDQDKLPLVPGRTTPSFGFSNVERAIRECMGQRVFGRAEQRAVIDFFGQVECVYCGTPNVQRWDHLTAIRNDGETVLGNVVLACGSCDDSKQHYHYRDFLLGGSPKSPRSRGVADVEQRPAKLDLYVQEFGYQVRPLGDRLTTDEQASGECQGSCRMSYEARAIF